MNATAITVLVEMNVGEKIKKLRLEKMMTQADLSGDFVTRNMLSLIEKDKAVPSLQTLNYIASRLNVSSAYLLADEREEKMLVKYSKISDIRIAFKNKSYRICMDMCKRLGRTHDDEIKLIMAECAFKLAKEEIYSDRIRAACVFLDEAVLYSSETVYNTKYIDAAVGLLFDYLGELSPSIISDNMDFESFEFEKAKTFCGDDDFLRYIIALKDVDNQYSFDKEVFHLHTEARRFIKMGELDKAYNLLNDALKLDEVLPGVLLYNIFSDLEYCCRQLGNSKNTRMYSDEKVTQLERILS